MFSKKRYFPICVLTVLVLVTLACGGSSGGSQVDEANLKKTQVALEATQAALNGGEDGGGGDGGGGEQDSAAAAGFKALVSKMAEFNKDAREIKRIVLTADGGWLLLYDESGYIGDGLPQPVMNHL